MWYLLLAALLADLVLLGLLIRSVSETTLGANASRLVAILFACFAFYSPAAVLKSLPVNIDLPIATIGNRWVRYAIIGIFAGAIAYTVFQAWMKRGEEFRSLLQAAWRFIAIGALVILARILIPRVL